MAINMVAPLEIGICVQDMALMTDFYINVLGCHYISLAHAAKEKSQASGFTASGYEIVRLQTNNGERIKFNRPVEAPLNRQHTSHILSVQGTTYLTFIVKDLNDIVKKLRNANVSILPPEGMIEVRPGVKLCTAKDPEGNHLEFVEYEDISSYRSDLFNKV